MLKTIDMSKTIDNRWYMVYMVLWKHCDIILLLHLTTLCGNQMTAIEGFGFEKYNLIGHSSIETTRIYLLSTEEEHARQLETLGLVR